MKNLRLPSGKYVWWDKQTLKIATGGRGLDIEELETLLSWLKDTKPKLGYKISNTFLVKPTSVYCKESQFTYGDIKVEEVWE